MRNLILVAAAALIVSGNATAQTVQLGTFDVDASPPVGSPMAYDATLGVQAPLSCRGVVILGGKQPIVLCAIDWIGIGNGGHQRFREALARAAGTDVAHVAVHTLHQHDAPHWDESVNELLTYQGIQSGVFDAVFVKHVMNRAANAVKQAVASRRTVTHLGTGTGVIKKVASNRRILGADGKVEFVRYTATRDPKIRAKPVGTIDPALRMITFYENDEPIAALTYYATHPQSYYRTGLANPDFPGMARNQREKDTGFVHIHFNGAGGNIGAGKWNDGSKENRQVLADRVHAGMAAAWKDTTRVKLAPTDIGWVTRNVVLPFADHLDISTLMKTLQDKKAPSGDRVAAARNLIWALRCKEREGIDVSCLKLGSVRILHMPGELFVEYQLAAQAMQPNRFVAMAAYGDYAPGYIGTEIAYGQGGYETSPRASRVAPDVEGVLIETIRELLAEFESDDR